MEDLADLLSGNKGAWDRFVLGYSGLILAAVRRVAGHDGETEDIAQDVFLRLCKNDYYLLRRYDPARAALSTWLTIVARSAAYDWLRKRRLSTQRLDDTPEVLLSVEPKIRDAITIPDGLLSPRQGLVMSLLYERELDVPEVAAALEIEEQTVRTTHHKAMLKLRAHFKRDLRLFWE